MINYKLAFRKREVPRKNLLTSSWFPLLLDRMRSKIIATPKFFLTKALNKFPLLKMNQKPNRKFYKTKLQNLVSKNNKNLLLVPNKSTIFSSI